MATSPPTGNDLLPALEKWRWSSSARLYLMSTRTQCCSRSAKQHRIQSRRLDFRPNESKHSSKELTWYSLSSKGMVWQQKRKVSIVEMARPGENLNSRASQWGEVEGRAV
ncbi:hypothetical protein NL676_002079 [Syzygium grande]|nr:hypothetical protein NL676_002079 [Syzygium grande]